MTVNDSGLQGMTGKTETMDKTEKTKINFGKIDPSLLEILACPVTKSALRYDAAAGELISDKAGLAFPVRDGIPIMLVEEARKLDMD